MKFTHFYTGLSGRRRLWLAIVAGLALRLILIAVASEVRGPDAFLPPDTGAYLTAATSLVSGHAFTDAAGQPEIFRTPGYPVLLACGVIVGHPIAFALIANLVLTALIVMLIYEIIRGCVNDENIAGTCALLVAVEPTMLLWSMKVMPETLFIAVFLAFVWAALRWLKSVDVRWAVAAAIALAASAYVRPIVYPLAVAAAIVSLVWPRRSAAFAVTCVLLLAPWHIRNARVAGFAGFTTLFDRVAYLSAGGSIVARRDHEPYAAVRAKMIDTALSAKRGDQAAQTRFMRRTGVSIVATDPLGYARTHVAGMVRTAIEPGAVEYLRMFGWYPEYGGALQRTVGAGLVRGTIDFAKERPLAFWSSIILGLLLLPLAVTPILAAWVMTARTRSPLLFVLVVIAYFLTASGGAPGSSRFRAPIVPLFVITTSFVMDARKRSSR